MINYVRETDIRSAFIAAANGAESIVCDCYGREVVFKPFVDGSVAIRKDKSQSFASNVAEAVRNSVTNDKCRIKFADGQLYYWHEVAYVNNPAHPLFGCLVNRSTCEVLIND